MATTEKEYIEEFSEVENIYHFRRKYLDKLLNDIRTNHEEMYYTLLAMKDNEPYNGKFYEYEKDNGSLMNQIMIDYMNDNHIMYPIYILPSLMHKGLYRSFIDNKITPLHDGSTIPVSIDHEFYNLGKDFLKFLSVYDENINKFLDIYAKLALHKDIQYSMFVSNDTHFIFYAKNNIKYSQISVATMIIYSYMLYVKDTVDYIDLLLGKLYNGEFISIHCKGSSFGWGIDAYVSLNGQPKYKAIARKCNDKEKLIGYDYVSAEWCTDRFTSAYDTFVEALAHVLLSYRIASMYADELIYRNSITNDEGDLTPPPYNECRKLINTYINSEFCSKLNRYCEHVIRDYYYLNGKEEKIEIGRGNKSF